jgi:phospholipid/cholesterol/gamma-HCH transport system permease protein
MVRSIVALGSASVRRLEVLGDIARFTARTTRAILLPPWRLRRLLRDLYDAGVLSVALICASGLVVGMVLGLQMHITLTRFGAEASLGAVVGLALIRELGPVVTGLLVTGRAGSAMTAEIGSMVVSEQLDGLRMMSIDPLHFVVKPKAIALTLVMPLLSALFIIFAIAGAYLIGVELLGLDSGSFISGLKDAVEFRTDVAQSLTKSWVFGMLLGLLATYRGYTCESNAAGVSRATTSTVVTTSVCILLANYVITALWEV